MQQRQTSRRRRPSSSNPRSMGQAAAGQSNGRLDVRVRGNAHQLLEKYKQMARDSQQAGDRVASEFYLQHADHYFRVLNEGRLRQEEMRARRSGNDQLEDDSEAADMGPGRGRDSDAENARSPAAGRGEKNGDDTRSRRRAPRSSERSRDNAKTEKAQPRSEPDDEDDVPQVLELHLTDGEAALAAFGGGESETAAKVVRRGKPDAESETEAGAEDAEAAEAPAPRRRGRPRKTAQPADS